MVFLIGAIIITVITVVVSLVLYAGDTEGKLQRQKETSAAIGALIAGSVVGALWTIALAVVPVSAGHVAVATWFGSVQPKVYAEGLHFMNPMYSTTSISVRRQTVDFSNGKERDADSILAISADRNTLTVQVQFPYSLNPAFAWKLYQRVGGTDRIENTLVQPAARAVVRDVLANFSWADAALSKRGEIELQLLSNLEHSVVADLTRLGFSPDEAKAAFTFLPTQLREVLPDEKVRNAIAERLAAEENLARQKVLTDIAKLEAERRANEGVGVSRLFSELPKGFKASEIALVLNALAEKERADALTKAVESGKIRLMVLPSTSPVAVSTPMGDQ